VWRLENVVLRGIPGSQLGGRRLWSTSSWYMLHDKGRKCKTLYGVELFGGCKKGEALVGLFAERRAAAIARGKSYGFVLELENVMFVFLSSCSPASLPLENIQITQKLFADVKTIELCSSIGPG
jgi:hypothetical protein